MNNHYLPIYLKDDASCEGCLCLREEVINKTQFCKAKEGNNIISAIDYETFNKRPDWCPLISDDRRYSFCRGFQKYIVGKNNEI